MLNTLKSVGRALLAAGTFVALLGSAQATVIYSGSVSIAAGDPTQLGRISRGNIPQDWTGGETFQGVINPTVSYAYKVLTLNIPALEAGYVAPGRFLQISIDSASINTFVAAFSPSYVSTSIATNWLGDAGSSGNPFGGPRFFQIIIPAGQPLVLVLNETTAGAGIAAGPAGILVEAFTDTQFTDLVAVPEPTSLLLMSTGVMALLALRRRRVA